MESPLTTLPMARRDELIESIAGRIQALGMCELAIFFLEMHSPLAFLGSQVIYAAQPFLGWAIGDRRARELAQFAEDPASAQHLIQRLQADARSNAGDH